MFEQATLTSGPAGKRALTTLLGMTSQVALVSFAVLAPMVWPQVLPNARFWESLAPPLPPGPKQLGGQEKHAVRPLRPWKQLAVTGLVEPIQVPDRVDTTFVDEPTAAFVVGAPGGIGGSPDGVVGSIVLDAARDTVRPAPPPVVVRAVAKAPEPVPVVVQRLPPGGMVHLGQALRKTPPLYPEPAKSAHITGDVVLECVVGTDGRMLEVKVKSGNPLLVRAAVDAVRQWAYEPSQLNGLPIEIITNITVSFKLN